ncbi:MAG: hypothetical protein JWQ57_3526 [Mucilaginibacter sp.]|nr:hypothetical protein [Mucilaginibacter sp.]
MFLVCYVYHFKNHAINQSLLKNIIYTDSKLILSKTWVVASLLLILTLTTTIYETVLYHYS